MASRSCPSYTRLFHSGILLFTGHPECVLQKGVPQSMHRAAWTLRSTSLCLRSMSSSVGLSSPQSVTRSRGSRYGSGLRR